MGYARLKQVGQVVGYAAGVVLIALAVWKGLAQVDLDRLSAAPYLPLLAIGGTVLAKIGLSGLMFWSVTYSFEPRPPVGLGRMTRLMSASTLLNYVPLRLGLISRAVYLKRFHGLSLVHSVQIWLVVATVTTIVCSVTILAIQTWSTGDRPVWGGGAVVALILFSILTGPIVGRILSRRMEWGWSWILIKFADLLIWGIRLWLAMLIVGVSITFPQAVAAAAAGNLAALLSVTPNGLGLREWLIIGLLSLSGQVGTAEAALAIAIDRGVEVLVVVPTGLWSLHGVRRTMALS